MITADQIQTILNHTAKAPTTVGQAMADSAAFAALVDLGHALAAGRKLAWTDEIKADPPVIPAPAVGGVPNMPGMPGAVVTVRQPGQTDQPAAAVDSQDLTA